jgi:hypothetical protein
MMGDFLQQFLLSDVVLFLIVGLVLLLITSWAYSIKEYAGYVLGWLLGILLIILMSAFTLNVDVDAEFSSTPSIMDPFMLFGLVLVTFAGLGLGFGLLGIVRGGSQSASRLKRSLAVAFTNGFALSAAYFMLISDRSTRLAVAVFVLALAVGAMFNYVLSRQLSRRQASSADIIMNEEIDGYPPDKEAVEAMDLPSPLAQRIHNIQQRVRYRGQTKNAEFRANDRLF